MSYDQDPDRFWEIVGDIDRSYSPIERAASDPDLLDAYIEWWNECTTNSENATAATETLKDKYAEISMRYALGERDYIATLNLIAERLNNQ